MNISIGAAAQASGVNISTIRYYENIGLIDPPQRSGNGRRIYSDDLLAQLSFIRHARSMDFAVDDIRALLKLRHAPARPCAEVDAIARARVAGINERIAQLTALKDELSQMIGACAQKRVADCPIINGLSSKTVSAQ